MNNIIRKAFFFNQPMRDKWVQEQALLVRNGARVLDVGAGSCPYKQHFSHCEYFTQDFQQLKPEQLRDHKGYGKVDYVCDINNIPVEDNSFDVILCTEVLEHVPEPIRALEEFARIVKVGGRVIITAPLGSGLHQEPYHYYGGYTPHWYRRFLGINGFSEISIVPNGNYYSFFGQECVRFATLLAPWRGKYQFLWMPVWAVGLPVLLSAPLLARWWDLLDQEKTFTVGYHVTAVRGKR